MELERYTKEDESKKACLENLSLLSKRIGCDPMHVLSAGGNTSVKCDDSLWVKASGTRLADAMTQEIFVEVDQRALKSAVLKDPSCDANKYVSDSNLRPSIEASLHCLSPYRYVVHTHSINALAWLVCNINQEEISYRLRALNHKVLEYASPGSELTKSIIGSGFAQILLLRNHGVIVGANSASEAEELILQVSNLLMTPLRSKILDASLSGNIAALENLAFGSEYELPDDGTVHILGIDDFARSVATKGALYPDHVIFLPERLKSIDEGSELPPNEPALLIKGIGVLVNKDASDGAKAMLLSLALTLQRVSSGRTLKYLSAKEVKKLVARPDEQYRIKIGSQRR